MRLINTQTLELEEHAFESKKRQYAILSHTWGDGEVTLQEMSSPDPAIRDSLGWQKILHTCAQARNSGLRYAWIDTCCIDKTSSAELSESINSMYKWYKMAHVCYVYMSDVGSPASTSPIDTLLDYEDEAPMTRLSGNTLVEFQASRWFRRGWTLQELVAPDKLRFYCRQWRLLGQTTSLREFGGLDRSFSSYSPLAFRTILNHLSAATTVPASILAGFDRIQNYSVAQRMSWASGRSTTRVEDEAYCLLGIFDINMPLLYGEGREAFKRLQEEIIKVHYDQSIFAWEDLDSRSSHTKYQSGATALFASSPQQFGDCEDVVTWTATDGARPYHLTNRGLEISFFHPRTYAATSNGAYRAQADQTVGILQCRRADDFSKALAVCLSEPTAGGEQVVQTRRDGPYSQRRTRASLKRKDMAGPMRTTVVSEPLRNISTFLYEPLQRRLLIDTTLPGAIHFHLLEPAAQWNRLTLVMTPSFGRQRLLSAPSSFLEAYQATVCFDYDSQHYIIHVRYGLGSSRGGLSMLRRSCSTLDTETAVAYLENWRPPTSKNCTAGTDVFCSMKFARRLGQDVVVLRIGLVSTSDAEESSGESDSFETLDSMVEKLRKDLRS